MFCPKCGAQNVDNAQFCAGCGTPMNFSATPGGDPNMGGQVPQTQAGTGLAPNVAALLSYVLGFITGLIFYFIEKDRFVRFHAMQSILVSAAIFILSIVVSILSVIGLWRLFFLITILNTVIWIGTLAIWIICMLKAYKGQWFKLPVIGDMAEKFAK